jgi:enoyl-[acyl-carrier protein] reductase II
MTGPLANRYTRLVGIDHPVVQEGLGPFRTPKIAAAVSQAGGLGTVSMPGMPDDLRDGARTFRAHIEECASLTDRPFAVNIPVGVDRHTGEVVAFTDVYIRAADPADLVRQKLESMQRAQTTGDTENSLVLAGQVTGAINELVSIADFVPGIVDEAAAVLDKLARPR